MSKKGVEIIRGKYGYTASVVDLDDTWWDINGIVRQIKNDFLEQMEKLTGIPQADLNHKFEEKNTEAFGVMKVNPQRWNWIGEQLGEVFGSKNLFVEQAVGFEAMYRTVPQLHDGANEVLGELSCMGKVMAVSHAGKEWTMWKLEQTGLKPFFTDVYCADVNRVKSIDDWKEGMRRIKANPRLTIGVGDNLTGDIIPLDGLGVQTFWYYQESGWHIYSAGEMPKRTRVIDNLRKIPELIRRN